MNLYEDKVEVNAGLLILLVYIAISWLGIFQKIEGWFAHGELATVRISSEECVDGYGEDITTSSCNVIYFYSVKTNKLIQGKCVRACEQQVNLLSPSGRYRIEVTNFPIIGKRILNVENWNY